MKDKDNQKVYKGLLLIQAAKDLIHQKGYHQTTLADIALHAKVPLGNVYYYYKTKDAICQDVIDSLSQEHTKFLQALGQQYDEPKARLLAFLNWKVADLDLIARFGCPLGSFSEELAKEGGILADQIAKIFHELLHWVEQQFIALKIPGKNAADLSLHWIAGIQGAYLLAHALKDPNLPNRQAQRLGSWLETLSPRLKTVRKTSIAEAI